MGMRGFIGLSLTAALAAGCGTAPQPGEETQGALGLKLNCPDPTTDCTVSNGGGVYTEEFGFAGIGARHFMITRFINNSGGGVSLQGRYYDAATNTWQVGSGSIYYANYAGKTHLPVVSVSESYTAPTWTLFDASTSSYLTVGTSQMLGLQLIIAIDTLYTLDFNAVAGETIKASIRKFNMRWWPTSAQAPQPTQYCYRADFSADQVVFQQGMVVNPVTAMVLRDSTTAGVVTLSCRYGAPATARLWGYIYRSTNPGYTNVFDAALHMKRASYCGDDSFYTKSGTQIRIWDDLGIQTDAMYSSEIEAWWTPKGATCIGPRRHWSALYAGAVFNKSCDNVLLPPCDTAPKGMLADAASPPAP